MKCPKGWKNCEVCKEEYNPWLLYNEKIVDFIRWKEFGFIVVLYTVCLVWLGWWGLLLASILDKMFHLNGGPVIGTTPQKEYPPNICSAGIEGCQICNNEYDHEFNESYKPETFLQSLHLPFIN